ncbi:DUF262 domain-containing protein [Clostridium butyricum]
MIEKESNVNIELALNGDVVHFKFQYDKLNNVYMDDLGIKVSPILDDKEHCYDAKRVDNVEKYVGCTESMIQLFIDEYNAIKNKYVEALESGIEYTEENSVEEEEELKGPYDPNSIRVTQGRFSLKEIVEMIKGTEDDEPILDLSPDFQRNFVWDITRKSRLIESILLKIPLPVFYLSRDNDGKYQVVDGAQRLSVISGFFCNEFKLRNLEYLKEDCEDKFFSKANHDNYLTPKLVRALKSYQIDCNIIEPNTPYKVKLDIFKRLNTGGRSLNRQEIRNAILKKNSREFIKRLAESLEFIRATDNGVKAKRMMDQELIIRFIGFYLIYNEENLFPELKYNGKMDEFLDSVVEILNTKYTKIPLSKIELDFYNSMDNATLLFGGYAFRKVELDYKNNNRNMINKSLFSCFSVLLCKYETEEAREKGIITDNFAEELANDKYLYDSITYATNDVARVDTAFMKIDIFLNKIFGGKYD